MTRILGKWKECAAWAALWIGVSLLVFRVALPPGAVLMASDENIGVLAHQKRAMENSAVYPWEQTLWGMPHPASFRPGFLLERAMPLEAFANWFHAICLAGAAWWLALYLRGKGLRFPAAAFGALVAFWTGTNLTLAYAGHNGKYAILFFLAMAVWALGKWSATKRGGWAVAAGGAAGGMFLEQGDVALFCSLCLLPVALAEWRAAWGGSWRGGAKRWAGSVLPALAAVGLMAAGTTLSTLHGGIADSTESMDKAAKWDYVTQWSQPPGESFDFIAPGWMGWRSGEESGPYRGRTGQSAEWKATGRGFRNFRLESVYVGALPLLSAILGLGALARRRRKDGKPSAWNGTAAAWAAAGALALVLSFGKYTPLYRVLGALPGFSEIRNPNKFLHFFQVAWGVLAAFGLDAAFEEKREGVLRKWAWGCLAAAGLAAAAWTVVTLDGASGAVRWMGEGWSLAAGKAIQQNRAFALLWLAIACGLAGAAVGGLAVQRRRGGSPRWGKALAWLPAAFVLAEAACVVGPRYIQAMPGGYVAENELVRHLRAELGPNRLAFAPGDQAGLYNFWLTFLFPYYGLSSVEVTQLPRPPADYAAFWQAVRDPLRQWRLTGVSHVLAHGSTAAAMLRNPVWAAQLEPVWAYRPREDGQGGVATDGVDLAAPAGHAEFVLRMKERPPRIAVVKKWRTALDPDALAALADPARDPLDEILIAADGTSLDLENGGRDGHENVETVEELKSGCFSFRVKTDGPAVVRVAERWNQGWRATLDGKTARVLRCDYMFLGVWIPEAGEWDVRLVYSPREPGVALQLAGLFLALAGLLSAMVPRFKRADGNGAPA